MYADQAKSKATREDVRTSRTYPVAALVGSRVGSVCQAQAMGAHPTPSCLAAAAALQTISRSLAEYLGLLVVSARRLLVGMVPGRRGTGGATATSVEVRIACRISTSTASPGTS